MKISQDKPVINLETYLKASYKKESPSDANQHKTVPNSENVQLSPRAKEIQKIKEVVEATPEIREEKVAALKQAIEKGTYEVNGKKTAEKLIKESLIDLIL